MRTLRFIGRLFLAGSLLGAATAPAAEPPSPPAVTPALAPAPVGLERAIDLRMYTASGRSFRLDDYVQIGRMPPVEPTPVVLLFGAHWCQTCKAFAARASQVLGTSAKHVFVHIDDVDRGEGKNDTQIAAAIVELAQILPPATVILQRGDGGLVQSWGFDRSSLPAAVLITPDGRVFKSLQHASEEEERQALLAFQRAISAEGSGTSNLMPR